MKSGDSDVWTAYRKCRNKVTALVQSSKCRYLNNYSRFSKHFKYLSSHGKAQHHPDVNFSCEDVNCHFLSIATKTVSDLPSVDTSSLQYTDTSYDVPSLSLSEVSVQDVIDYISQLDSNKAVGIDDISTKFIRVSPQCMAVLITKLINKSILSSSFPNCWKAAIVTPVL